jgi:hypothetical protein
VLTLQVSKGASRVRIPPSPQVAVDVRGVNTTELAWAAGVYDGEGSASTYLPKLRKTRVRQMAVYQAGDAIPPPLLFRFRAAVGDVGLIHGATRGSLYQWHSKRHIVVDGVSELLWPWIGELKRAQLRRAAAEVGRLAPVDRPAGWTADEKAAWAAGFFDGEGTVGLAGRPGQPAVAMSIPQASSSGVPETLVRFREIVDAGSITGPRMVSSPWSKLPQYRWQLARLAEIERVVAMLYPYADVVKRERMTKCVHHVRAARAMRR